MVPQPNTTTGQQSIQLSPTTPVNHPSSSTSQREHNYPCLDLLEDNKREDFINICVLLYNALIKEDWAAATTTLNSNRNIVRYAINEHYETVLHIAAAGEENTERVLFVDQLVKMMHKNDLKLKNKNGNTALCTAAAAGSVKIAEILVTKNNELLTIPNEARMTPLYIATLYENYDMVNYLYDKSHQSNDPVGHQSIRICF